MIKYTQNFLTNHSAVNRLVEKTLVAPGDTVIDLGAGEGVITEALSRKLKGSGRIVAVELDTQLYNTLTERFKGQSSVEIVNEDISKYIFPNSNYRIVANIPFNITSEVLNKVLHPSQKLLSADLVLQKEAAELYGGEQLLCENSLKSLLAYPIFEFEITHYFKSYDFMPEPNVDIVFLSIVRRKVPLISDEHIEDYRDFATYISQDRVGEGNWKKIFTKTQLTKLNQNTTLKPSIGIKSQEADDILEAFKVYSKYSSPKVREEVSTFIKSKLEAEKKIIKEHRTR